MYTASSADQRNPQPGVFKIQADVCDLPHESKSKIYTIGGVLLMVLMICLTAVRLLGKYYSRRLGADDALIVVCFTLGMVVSAVALSSKHIALSTVFWSRQLIFPCSLFPSLKLTT